jgi:hypothetical protein
VFDVFSLTDLFLSLWWPQKRDGWSRLSGDRLTQQRSNRRARYAEATGFLGVTTRQHTGPIIEDCQLSGVSLDTPLKSARMSAKFSLRQRLYWLLLMPMRDLLAAFQTVAEVRAHTRLHRAQPLRLAPRRSSVR